LRNFVAAALGIGLLLLAVAAIILEGRRRVAFSDQQYAADLHIHSSRSPDSVEPPAAIVERAMRIGLHAIAITDHYVDRAFRELLEGSATASGLAVLAADERFIRVGAAGRALTVIKGKEVSTTDGVHIIALAYRGHVHNFQSHRETLREIQSLGGIAIVAHPFNTMSHGIGATALTALLDDSEVREWIDGIEIYNANSFYPQWRANDRAEAFARERGVPGVAVSDAHQARHVGFGATLLDAPLTVSSGDALAAALRAAIRSGTRSTSRTRVPLKEFLDWFVLPKVRSLLTGRRMTIEPPADYMDY
jgi:predicted metal-dependent phosphoesterase TrpH